MRNEYSSAIILHGKFFSFVNYIPTPERTYHRLHVMSEEEIQNIYQNYEFRKYYKKLKKPIFHSGKRIIRKANSNFHRKIQ